MSHPWLKLPFALAAAAFALVAGAQAFPSKPLRVVVPYAAGGLPDTMTRLAAARMTEILDQQVVVDNRAGAGGIDPVGNTPAQYAARIRVNITQYAKVVKTSGAKAEEERKEKAE